MRLGDVTWWKPPTGDEVTYWSSDMPFSRILSTVSGDTRRETDGLQNPLPHHPSVHY